MLNVGVYGQLLFKICGLFIVILKKIYTVEMGQNQTTPEIRYRLPPSSQHSSSNLRQNQQLSNAQEDHQPRQNQNRQGYLQQHEQQQNKQHYQPKMQNGDEDKHRQQSNFREKQLKQQHQQNRRNQPTSMTYIQNQTQFQRGFQPQHRHQQQKKSNNSQNFQCTPSSPAFDKNTRDGTKIVAIKVELPSEQYSAPNNPPLSFYGSAPYPQHQSSSYGGPVPNYGPYGTQYQYVPPQNQYYGSNPYHGPQGYQQGANGGNYNFHQYPVQPNYQQQGNRGNYKRRGRGYNCGGGHGRPKSQQKNKRNYDEKKKGNDSGMEEKTDYTSESE